jgi:hypothetical protein
LIIKRVLCEGGLQVGVVELAHEDLELLVVHGL